MVFEQFLSVGGILSLVINVVITAVVIMLADKIITHEIELKHSLIMALIAYLVLPLVLSYLVLYVPIIGTVGIILPLIAWIILGELLLKAGRKQKAIVAVIAYVINIFLLTYLSSFIIGFLHF